MNKIRIIDLLNKIANNEKVPKRVRYINLIWEYDDEIKDYIHDDLYLFYKINGIGLTENYVEIIEEEKKIPDEININLAYIDKEYLLEKEDVDRKINEIINRHNILVDKVSDYLKSKGE